jgi:hypothetical protein
VQNSADHRASKADACVLKCAEKGTGAWLRAQREDEACRQENGHFLIAVAVRLGIQGV